MVEGICRDVSLFTTASQARHAPDLAPEMLMQELDNHWFNRWVLKKTDPATPGVEPTGFWVCIDSEERIVTPTNNRMKMVRRMYFVHRIGKQQIANRSYRRSAWRMPDLLFSICYLLFGSEPKASYRCMNCRMSAWSCSICVYISPCGAPL